VIESLARVLRMTPPEREHLLTVAGLALPAQTAGPPEADDTLRRGTARFRNYRKGYQHPAAGLLSLDYIKLGAASDDQQHLIVLLPADQATADKLRQLR
jgi:MmyB-like transcription regulator ligand binding domain